VIHAEERGTPKNRKKLEWKLITDLPVQSRKDVIEELEWYAMRWKIEVFHILKSGCKAEDSKLRTAERGEIAVRIIRAARELGLATVQVYGKADKEQLAVRLADECVEVGPAQSSKSYLNHDAILAAANATGADAIPPGYGFLAENAEFAAAGEAAGLVFVGPTARSIRLMGDKVAARKATAAAGVPTVPGSRGRLESSEDAFAWWKRPVSP